MSIEIISPTDLRWRQYLDTVKHDFYQLPGYLELEAKRCEASAEAIAIVDGEKSFFLPYLIRDCHKISDGMEVDEAETYDVISPYGYAGMLLDTPDLDLNFLKQCWLATQQYWQSRNVCSAFLRLHIILNEGLDRAIEQIDSRVVCNRSAVVVCDLNRPLDELWQQMRRNNRTQIDKLKKSGFTVKVLPIELYLDEFIDIYYETMHRVNAASTYFFKKSYFEALISALEGQLYLFAVELEDRVVAAILVTEFSGILQYYLGGTKTEFLRQSLTALLLSYTIEWGKNRQNKYFNLGGGIGGQRDSLYAFKAGFSKQTKTFATIGSIVDRDRYDRLVNLRAKALNLSVAELTDSKFFPAYRSC
jgi:hypothetical protein